MYRQYHVSHLALYLPEQKICQLINTHTITTARTSVKSVNRARTVGSPLQDGLTGYLQESKRNTSGSHPPGTSGYYATNLFWEGWTNGAPPWAYIRPCYHRMPFAINTVTLRAQGVLPTWALLCWNSWTLLTCRSSSLRNTIDFCYHANTDHEDI